MKRTIFTLCLITLLATAAQAQIVGATDNTTQGPTSRTDNSPVYRPTGGSIRFALSSPAVSLTVAYNHQITSSFMIGGGVGLADADFFYDSDFANGHYGLGGPCLPLFLETEVRTPRYKWSVFANLRVGYNVDLKGDGNLARYLYLTATAGVSYKNLSYGVGYYHSRVTPFSGTLSYNLPVQPLAATLRRAFL